MPPQTQAVNATMAWLRSSWHIQVPLAWLETCVDWVQEEGEGGRLTQQQINQQVKAHLVTSGLNCEEIPRKNIGWV